MRILIADDHPLYREAAATQVRRLYREADVQEVSSLAELCSTTADGQIFDLILVDYHMPGMSADALANLVTDLPSTPLAVISGVASNAETWRPSTSRRVRTAAW